MTLDREQMKIRLEPREKRRLQKYAKRLGMSMNNFTILLIKRGLVYIGSKMTEKNLGQLILELEEIERLYDDGKSI